MFRELAWNVKRIVSSPNQNALFVGGNQKGGTSVVGQLIAAACNLSLTPDFRVTDSATNDFTSCYTKQIGISEFIRRHRYEFSRDVVKEPALTFLYADLASHFPRAQFVVVVRDPRENIRSQLNRLGVAGNLRDLDAYDQIDYAWRHLLDNEGLGLSGSNYVEKLSHRWVRAAEIAMDVHDVRGVAVLYEDFIEAKKDCIHGICTKLNLKVLSDITMSVDIQYQPAGTPVPWEEFFGEENLSTIERICAPHMRSFGYALTS